MMDFLRIARRFKPFYSALSVHLIEVSPALRKKQVRPTRACVRAFPTLWVCSNRCWAALPLPRRPRRRQTRKARWCIAVNRAGRRRACMCTGTASWATCPSIRPYCWHRNSSMLCLCINSRCAVHSRLPHHRLLKLSLVREDLWVGGETHRHRPR